MLSFTRALNERKDKLSPEDANKLKLPRVEKIDFKGKPHLVDHKPTKTGMILVRRGDVLISGINAEKGAICVFDEAEKATATIHYSAYEIDTEVASPEFLRWFLRSKYFQNALIEQVGGGIKTEIRAKKFLSINIPIPSKQAQAKIVEKLNAMSTLSSELDKLDVENAKLASHLERLILMKVIGLRKGGKWEPNEPFDIPDDWEWKELHELLIDKPRNGYSPTAVNYETDVKTLKLAATTSGEFKPQEFKYINEDISEDSYLWLEPGDVLIQRSNSMDYVGVSAIYDRGMHEFIYPDLMMKLRVTDEVSPEYLHLVLSSPFIRDYFRASASGTSGNMPKINQKTVMAVMIPVPPSRIQDEILSRASKLLGDLKELVGTLEKQRGLLPFVTESSITALLNKDWQKVEVKAPAHNLSFSIQQCAAALLNKGFSKGEMAIAKMLYLLQEVYGVKIGITFTAQNFGPYDSAVKKALMSGLTSKNNFYRKAGNTGREYFELLPNGQKILQYELARDTTAALDELMPIIQNADSYDIERLATVCKIIQDNQSVDERMVLDKMNEWKRDKFKPEDTKRSLSFIKQKGWDRVLVEV